MKSAILQSQDQRLNLKSIFDSKYLFIFCRAKNKEKSEDSKPAKKSMEDKDSERSTPSGEEKLKFLSTRKYFHKDEDFYVMDAKSIGNIGRYLNHSCNPNVFVQNCFVDTHDLRFPWVAFFAR